MGSLETPLTVLGLLLMGGALLSGLARRGFLSLTALFVLAGFALGTGWLDVLDFDPRSGPKGVAAMTFSLFVLSSPVAQGQRIFGIAALAVLVSIVVHGISDQPGSEWMARRAEAPGAA